ncbi:iron-sulfur cluster assembly scaffold protein [bacterium]|nr:iron-sulfur cluster assembly scaffold protein [bacterium]
MDFVKFKAIAENAPNRGELAEYDAVGEYTNSGCGDRYRIFLKMDGERIAEASFTTTGCSFGLAALSLVTGLAKGRTLEEALAITPEEIEAGVDGFPPRRTNYLVQAKEALEVAIQAVRERRVER